MSRREIVVLVKTRLKKPVATSKRSRTLSCPPMMFYDVEPANDPDVEPSTDNEEQKDIPTSTKNDRSSEEDEHNNDKCEEMSTLRRCLL